MKKQKYRLNKDMISQKIQGNEVVFDTEKSTIYTLNETATFILKRITLKKSLQEIEKSIMQEYDVDEAVAKKDVQSTVSDFIKKKILISS